MKWSNGQGNSQLSAKPRTQLNFQTTNSQSTFPMLLGSSGSPGQPFLIGEEEMGMRFRPFLSGRELNAAQSSPPSSPRHKLSVY